MHGSGYRGGTRIGRHRHKMGRSDGLPFPANSRNEGPAAAMDDINLRDYVDGRFWNYARHAVQNSLRLFRHSILVHLPAG